MMVTRRKIKINNREYVEYELDGKTYKNLYELLLYTFNTHGEFYQKIFGVSKKDAEDAGWLPSWNVFRPENPGFKKFIEDRGRIQKEVFEETISLREAVEQELFKQD